MAECSPEKSSWCQNGQVSVKRVELSDGLDTVLYKNILLFIYCMCASEYVLTYLLRFTLYEHKFFLKQCFHEYIATVQVLCNKATSMTQW